MQLDLAKQIFESGFQPVPTGHPKVKELLETSVRYIPLEDLDRKRNLCKWCWKESTPTYRHKYCSDECRLSAEIFCYPQQQLSKLFHLTQQDGLCANCEREFGKVYEGRKLEMELDHCVPIFKGGQSLGHENHQLLCKECHKIKSIEERKGWK